jgi:transposase-like protein
LINASTKWTLSLHYGVTLAPTGRGAKVPPSWLDFIMCEYVYWALFKHTAPQVTGGPHTMASQSLCGYSFPRAFELSRNINALVANLQESGVLHSKMDCPICGSAMRINKSEHFRFDGLCWRCPKRDCKRRESLRKDSYFAQHHLTLGTCFMILYCYLNYDKMLQIYMADICGVSEQTMVDWGNFIRESISHYFLKNPLLLGSHPVQADESLFGGRAKYHRGDHGRHQQSWVFGLAEEVTGLCVFWTVDDRKRETLYTLIKDHVLPGAIIKTDQWGAYATLGEEGFKHFTVNHSIQFVTEAGIHTQLIESCWSQIKSILKVRRGTAAGHLPGYLDYYSFCKLAKFQGQTRFGAFLKLIQVKNYY